MYNIPHSSPLAPRGSTFGGRGDASLVVKLLGDPLPHRAQKLQHNLHRGKGHMPTYEYECDTCAPWHDHRAPMAHIPEMIGCECGGLAKRRIGTAPTVAIAAKHQAAGNVLKKHGITNPATGEGLQPKRKEW